MRAPIFVVTAILMLLAPPDSLAGQFGEGYSSMVPGGPSDLRYRAFTIHTGRETCDLSAAVSEFRVSPNPLLLKVGDRIHRTNVDSHISELVIEAYGASGEFLPAVPIVVSTIDSQRVTETRSDWDYFEAVREGEDDLIVQWACPASGEGESLLETVRIIVGSVASVDE